MLEDAFGAMMETSCSALPKAATVELAAVAPDVCGLSAPPPMIAAVIVEAATTTTTTATIMTAFLFGMMREGYG